MVQMISSNSPSGSSEATERLLDRMSRTENNEEFLMTLKQEV
jgi:transcription termination factor Rho